MQLWKKTIYVYARLLSQHIKATLEYQANFVIMIVAAVISQVLGLASLWVIYQNIPSIQGWSFWAAASIYALVFLTEGVVSLFFEGVWHLSTTVNEGNFDRYLLRPISPIVQVLGSAVGLHGLGNIVLGGAILGQALQQMQIEWSIAKVGFALVLLLSAIVINLSINLAASSLAFWSEGSGLSFMLMVHNISNFARYPITIYSLSVKLLITVIFPYAFISFFPAAYLAQQKPWSTISLFTPLVAIYAAIASITIFNLGLKRYKSVGN